MFSHFSRSTIQWIGQKSYNSVTNALSFYGSKIILDCPNHFGRVSIVLDGSNSFWSCPNHFGNFQIIKISPEKSNLNLTKMIWAQAKWFGPNQTNLDLSKTIWTVQNNFGPIEGQGKKSFVIMLKRQNIIF